MKISRSIQPRKRNAFEVQKRSRKTLFFARVETDGGSQRMAVLILHAVPFWLAGIDPKRVRGEIRQEILHYQREVIDVLYAWRSLPKRWRPREGSCRWNRLRDRRYHLTTRVSMPGANIVIGWCSGLIGSVISTSGVEVSNLA